MRDKDSRRSPPFSFQRRLRYNRGVEKNFSQEREFMESFSILGIVGSLMLSDLVAWSRCLKDV
jgi:hypothetical protein